MSELRVFPRHSKMENNDFCFLGLRRKARAYGIDFHAFLKHGIPVSEIEHIDDHGLKLMIEEAKKEAENGR